MRSHKICHRRLKISSIFLDQFRISKITITEKVMILFISPETLRFPPFSLADFSFANFLFLRRFLNIQEKSYIPGSKDME